MKKLLLSLLLTALAAADLFGGATLTFDNMRHYDNNAGLSQNNVMCVFQDSKGFMWIGTKNGLNRFDGQTFKVFRRGEGDHDLKSNLILALHEDGKRNLLVGTDIGLFIYDQTTERFSYFDKVADSGQRPDTQVNYIFVDKRKRVWLATDSGTFLYDPAGGSLTDISARLAGYVSRWEKALYVDHEGIAYIGATGDGIVRYDHDSGVAEKFVDRADMRPTKIVSYKENYLLVGTIEQGAYVIDTMTRECRPVILTDGKDSNIFVRDIEQVADNEYWLGTESGIYILRDGLTYHVTHEDFNPLSLSDNAIYAICRDRDDGIWIGSYFGGVDYIPKSYASFRNYYPKAGGNSLKGRRVRDLVEDRKGNLWIATEDNGLNYYNTLTEEFTYISSDTRPTAISYKNIQCLNLSGDKLWIGTFTRGIDLLDTRTMTVKNYRKERADRHIANNDIFALFTDSEGMTWAGSSSGAYRYNASTDAFDFIDELAGLFISDIIEDASGCLWFTSYNHGVVMFDRRTQSWHRYENDQSNANSICRGRITCVFEDSRKQLWFGSEDAGICRFNRNDGTFTRTAIDSETGPNVIYCILEAESHNLWLSTNDGLVEFDPQKMEMIDRYGPDNGMQNRQFNYNAGISMRNGLLCFGGLNGFVSFDPTDCRKVNKTFDVTLTGFYIYNHEVKYGENILDKAVPYAETISLDYDESTFSIGFSAMDYASTAGCYSYMLDGIDKEWNVINTPGRISYNSLPPGNYTFKIKYSPDGHHWSGEAKEVKINIASPLWLTGWAIMVYVLAAAGLLYASIRVYNKRRREKELEKRKEAVATAKIDFFTNIAHEIRTPLTLITAPLNNLLYSDLDKNQARRELLLIENNTNRLLSLINQLLDFRKIESDAFTLSLKVVDVVSVVRRVITQFESSARSRNITIVFDCPADREIPALVDEEAMQKICTNLIDNAVKYGSTYVKVGVDENQENHSVVLTVENDGDAIPDNYRNKIFEAFFQIPDSARSKQPGTGIGLTLACSLVKLHNGKLWLDEDSSAVRFNVEIPNNFNSNGSLAPVETQPAAMKAAESVAPGVEKPLLKSGEPAKPVILVVEDSRDLQQFLVGHLKNSYKVLTADNGSEALTVLRNEIVSLVISDVMMPVMDGIELCREIKNDIELCHIPVVMLTAKTTLDNRIEGLEVGADAYLEKPFVMHHLITQVNNLIENRRKLRKKLLQNPMAVSDDDSHNKTDSEFMNRINDIVMRNIDDEAFDVDALASDMNMSRSNLHRKIKGLVDLTPGDLIRYIRLHRAAEMLAGGDVSVSEVRMAVGIRSQSYFSKAFKKQFGVLPKDYAKSQL